MRHDSAVALLFFAFAAFGLFLPTLPGAPMFVVGLVGGVFSGVHWVVCAPEREWPTFKKLAEWFDK